MDVLLEWKQSYADAVIQDYDLATTDGLRSALIISYFTDRRASADDALPDGSSDRRGWWGDGQAEDDPEGDLIGSRLWLLARAKATAETLQKCKEYLDEAVRWLVDDGVAKSVEHVVERLDLETLAFKATVIRPSGERISYRFNRVWEAL